METVWSGDKKWSDLFDSGHISNGSQVTQSGISKDDVVVEKKDCFETENEDENGNISIKEALDLFEGLNVNSSTSLPSMVPRGLVNPKNKCFLNVILQVIFVSKPFVRFLSILNQAHLPDDLPTFNAIRHVYREFCLANESDKLEKLPKKSGHGSSLYKNSPPALKPDCFYPLLNDFNKICTAKQQQQHVYQEDAQELLTYLLNRMQEELEKVVIDKKEDNKETESIEEEEGMQWQEVGKKKRDTTVLLTSDEDLGPSTPVSDIFGGRIRSCLRKYNAKPSVSTQLFYTLPLDIVDRPRPIRSLGDALRAFFSNEILEGSRSTKQTVIDWLPKILILHLKRFRFSRQSTGIQKLGKFLEYPQVLEVPTSLLSPPLQHRKELNKKYSLFAVICHHGVSAYNGHYTCDVKKFDGKWFHFNDAVFSQTSFEKVSKKSAYMLLYEQLP